LTPQIVLRWPTCRFRFGCLSGQASIAQDSFSFTGLHHKCDDLPLAATAIFIANAVLLGWSGVSRAQTLRITPAAPNTVLDPFYWQDDPTLESLKDQFARADTDAQRKQIAEQIQLRAIETVSYVTLGEATAQAAARKNITGMLPNAGVAVYWNIKKN
jgi:hypothetical protein